MDPNDIKDISKREINAFVRDAADEEQDLLKLDKPKRKKTFFESLFSKEKNKESSSFFHDYGVLSNIIMGERVKKWQKKNPDLFTGFLKRYRVANIQTLSSTYINITVFTTFLVSILSFAFFLLILFYFNNPLIFIILKAIFFSTILSSITFLVFYSYPTTEINSKNRDINTNLPFVIDHMSAVSTSGVSPTLMFQLIAQTEQYGEISTQVQRIMKYVEVFGHDLITAIKAVSATLPSEEFREFLDGFVTTIETGGDLDTFLSQKAEESMVQYRLNREKYIQTISTYSDVYTGLLIAAPLFFVASLTLISLLGGKIGGFEVQTVILFGVYVIVPIMNLLFLGFLTISQPEA